MIKLEIMDNRTIIEVETDYAPYKIIKFNVDGQAIELELSNANYEDLGNAMFPDGIMPEDFNKKVEMLNSLIEELSPVLDKEQSDWCLSKVTYDRDKDFVYFEAMEVE
jgi:hypothetical protein